MRRALCTLFTILVSITASSAHEPFDFRREREWEFLNQAKFRGSLVRLENGKAYIRMADGVERAFLPGCADGLSGSFLQRAVCAFPTNPTRPVLGEPGKEPLIALSADDLPDGPLSKWQNLGRLGGSFLVMNQSPRVERVNGRKSVVFRHPPWLLPLEFQTMVSDFYMPDSVTRGESLTVVAWLCNQGAAVDRETFLCWGEKDCGELDTPDFSYGCYEALQWYNEKVSLPYARFPKLNQWQQLAFVFSTTAKDKNRFDLRVFVNGEVVATKSLRKPDLKLLSNNQIFLGCAWEAWWGKKWATRPARPFTGALGGLQVYNRALTAPELLKLSGYDGAYNPSPADASHHAGSTTKLSWQSDTHKQFNVYLGEDRDAVAARLASTLKGAVSDRTFDPGKLETGKRYYWSVEAKGVQEQPRVWSFVVAEGGAAFPEPPTSAQNIPTTLEKLRWVPSPDALSQVLHFGTDPTAVSKGKAQSVKLKAYSDEAFLALELKLEKLARNTTYYWRVEQIDEAKNSAASNSTLWSFTTSAFDLEYDGPVSEPFPADVMQNGFYSRYMEAGGYPIISPPGNEDVHLRAARYAIRKLLIKRPDMLRALQSSHAACHLASQEHRGWGWSHFTCSCYGSGEAILRESAILMHEMGHQFHMNGAETMEPDFRHRLGEVFNAARRERLWMGDYGGSNMWENAAVCVSWWINDMTHDEGVLTPREMLREGDPRAFHLYANYWPGDLMIELHPSTGLQLDQNGNLSAWKNRGGVDYFKPNHGWRRYERSVGKFMASGKPKLVSSDGVSAIAFGGSDKFEWDQTTWESLQGNRAWSVDCWVRLDTATDGGCVVAWGNKPLEETRLLCGNDAQSFSLPGDIKGRWKGEIVPARWHHLAWVFTGGGAADNEGTLKTYINGALDGSIQAKLSLPKDVSVKICEGFKGSLGHLRIHNYDLNPLQLTETYERERPAHSRGAEAVAGRLLVDLDASILAPVYENDSWPLYPPTLNRPWLRSWTNSGILNGKLHNDASANGASQPKVTTERGIEAVAFDGKSRMISSFNATSGKTLEAWVYPEATSGRDSILQWGAFCIPSVHLRPGVWQHVVVIGEKESAELFVDARTIVKIPGIPVRSDRLILGSAWDGNSWREGLQGSIAEIRIHEGVLSQAQIHQNFSSGRIRRPSLPKPTENERVVVERKPALYWSLPLGEQECDVYLGTKPADVLSAIRSGPTYMGKKKSGELRPDLKSGAKYYWRVDPLDKAGQPLARGTLWHFSTVEGRVIALNAADFKSNGSVKSWTNVGTAAGAFNVENETESWQPSVVVREGRKGVDFSGRKGLISSFEIPTNLRGSGSFTVSLWAHYSDTRGLERDQTMLSWGRRPHSRAEFCWGSHPKSGAFIGGPKIEFGYAGRTEALDRFVHNAPVPDGWRHFAFTYDHSTHTLKIYADGVLNRQETILLDVKPGELLCLGGVRTGRRVDAPYSGVLDDISILDKALGEQDIARLANPAAQPQTSDCLIWLDSERLKEGLLASWKNEGQLGGEFKLEIENWTEPVTGTVKGRAAVQFDGRALLRSNFTTPASLTGNTAKSVEMWILNPSFADIETAFALAPSVAMKSYLHETNTCAANYNFGAAVDKDRDYRAGLFSTGQSCRNVGWKTAVSNPNEWHHVAWVYSGGYKGTFKVYVDGKLVNERGYFAIDTIAGYPMHVGGGWNTARGLQTPFSGALHSLRAYDYALSETEIQELSR